MELAFHPEALAEFKAAIVDYEQKQAGLGAAFADEVLRTIELARVFPRMGAPEQADVRCLITKRFPFIIYYAIMAEKLWVWAIMHAAREPGYWKSRQP